MPKISSRTRTVMIAGGLTAVLAAPFAGAAGEGRPLDGGARNPSNNPSQEYTRETEVIAQTNTYGTRQSNKSDNGGGAVYGCRSKAGGTPANNEPCLRGTNLADGLAFEFNTNAGVLGGTITVAKGGDTTKPFTTNATGVADGLNADRVDGRQGTDLLGKTEKAADAEKVDGVEGADLARANDLLFARVGADGAGSGRGVTNVATAGATTTVTFNRDVNACSYTVTSNDTATPTETFAAASTGARTVDVVASTAGTPFHLQVIC